MAESDVVIVNRALVRLGQATILSFDDLTDVAVTAKALYGPTREELTAEHPWNFAIRRAALVELATAPLYGFLHAYQLPPGGDLDEEPLYCLRVLDTDSDETWTWPLWGWWSTRPMSPLWQIEGRTLVSDEPAVSIRYIARITDPVQFSPHFTRAFSMVLTAELAGPLRQSDQSIELWQRLAAAAISRAKAVDAQEGRYAPRVARDLLIVR